MGKIHAMIQKIHAQFTLGAVVCDIYVYVLCVRVFVYVCMCLCVCVCVFLCVRVLARA